VALQASTKASIAARNWAAELKLTPLKAAGEDREPDLGLVEPGAWVGVK
jgi:hypothetical protein